MHVCIYTYSFCFTKTNVYSNKNYCFQTFSLSQVPIPKKKNRHMRLQDTLSSEVLFTSVNTKRSIATWYNHTLAWGSVCGTT